MASSDDAPAPTTARGDGDPGDTGPESPWGLVAAGGLIAALGGWFVTASGGAVWAWVVLGLGAAAVHVGLVGLGTMIGLRRDRWKRSAPRGTDAGTGPRGD
ncbi:hypothetical protein AB3X52_02910 [Nocardioides sp. DS6]|uniref:DUF2530 domain-containing protein n=1 Tax=Nocardioides eburneus TaxID=3231482 RepID=A0ABV3SVF3_9ACTN